MLRWFLRSRPKLRVKKPDRRRPALEELERRDCPAITLDYTVEPLSGTAVRLQGSVVDAAYHNLCDVYFSGVVQGSVGAGSDGAFCLDVEASDLGEIQGYAEDDSGNVSSVVVVEHDSTAPQVSFSIRHGDGKMVTLCGSVVDEDPSQTTVTFSGVASGQVMPGSDGSFSFTVEATALGNIHADVVDTWGLTGSADASNSVAAPLISGFSVAENSANVWCFEGTATGAGQLTYTLSGLPAVNGTSGTLDTSNSFSVDIAIPQDQSGTAIVTITDVWGQTSTATYCVG